MRQNSWSNPLLRTLKPRRNSSGLVANVGTNRLRYLARHRLVLRLQSVEPNINLSSLHLPKSQLLPIWFT